MKFFYGSVFEIWLYFQKQIRKSKNTVMFSLTSHDEKTWLRMSPGVRSFRSGFRQRTFFNQPEISTTSDSKVMTQIVVFMVFGDLDLDLWLLFTKKNVTLAGYAESTIKKIILIGAKLWPVGGVTDKQTDRHADRQTVLTNILCEKSKTFAK